MFSNYIVSPKTITLGTSCVLYTVLLFFQYCYLLIHRIFLRNILVLRRLGHKLIFYFVIFRLCWAIAPVDRKINKLQGFNLNLFGLNVIMINIKIFDVWRSATNIWNLCCLKYIIIHVPRWWEFRLYCINHGIQNKSSELRAMDEMCIYWAIFGIFYWKKLRNWNIHIFFTPHCHVLFMAERKYISSLSHKKSWSYTGWIVEKINADSNTCFIWSFSIQNQLFAVFKFPNWHNKQSISFSLLNKKMLRM